MKASKAQAKFLARCWGTDFKPAIVTNKKNDPTALACLKRGWLTPTDERGTFPNGWEFVRHEVSPDGLKALAKALGN